jgi:hypothetical protein
VWVECCYVVGGCGYSQLHWELYCVWFEYFYVIGGCDYSQLYRELYCVRVECFMCLVAVITVSCIGNCVACGLNLTMNYNESIW